MKKTTAIAMFLGFGASAAGAGAVPDNVFEGSDTLNGIMDTITAVCGESPALTYKGSGSSKGEAEIKAGNQEVSTMSRFIAPGLAAANGCAEGISIGLDGLSVVASETSAAGCQVKSSGTVPVTDQNGVAGLDCPGCVGSNYIIGAGPGAATNPVGPALPAWGDVLRVLFYGLHHDGTVNCASDVRFSMANNFNSVFTSACGDGSCTQVRHLFRRGEGSGTHDTFRNLLQAGDPDLTPSPAAPFCNGLQNQDNDPIRRPCSANENVCSPVGNGTLGLVLAVNAPDPATLPAGAQQYNATPCARGRFAYRPQPASRRQVCPNTSTSLFGQCLMPQTSAGEFGCLNSVPLNNCPIGPNVNCRSYNVDVRDATGNTVVSDFGYYRIHQNTKEANSCAADANCREVDSTRQIGCLVGVSPCSLGFGGREAADTQDCTQSLALNGILPTDANIVNRSYPMARDLWLATLGGFENLGDAPGSIFAAEHTLAQCVIAQASAVVPTFGFVNVPMTCRDFDTPSCGGVQACSNNPAGFQFPDWPFVAP